MTKEFSSFSSFIIYDTPLNVNLTSDSEWFLIYAYLIPTNSGDSDVCLLNKTSKGYQTIVRFTKDAKLSTKVMYKVTDKLFKVEGNKPIRLVFASRSNSTFGAKPLLNPKGTTSSIDEMKIIACGMRRFINDKNPLHNLCELMNKLFPENLFRIRTIGFNPKIYQMLLLFFKRMEKGKLLDEFVQLVHYIDINISLENNFSQGIGLFVSYFMNVFPDLIDLLIPIFMNQKNYIYFLGTLSILKKKDIVCKIIGMKQPMFQDVSYEPLSNFVSYLIELSNDKIKFHKEILDLISLASRDDEIRMIFNINNINSSLHKNKVKLSLSKFDDNKYSEICITKNQNKVCLDERTINVFNLEEKIPHFTMEFQDVAHEWISVHKTLKNSDIKEISIKPKMKSYFSLYLSGTILVLIVMIFVSHILCFNK